MDISILNKENNVRLNIRVAGLIMNDNKVLLQTCDNVDFYSLPGGRVKYMEDTLCAIKRELKEETGATAHTYISLGELYPTPGYCNEVIYMFAAKNLTFGEQCTDEDEFLDVVKMPFEKAVQMVTLGEIKDAKTQTAILKLKILKDSNKF